MSELTFTKSFLQTLDNKPVKYSPNHIFPPSILPIRTPYTLPKLPHPPYPLPSSTSATGPAPPPPPPGSTPNITITLKSTRTPQIDLTIPDVSPGETKISQLKDAVNKDLFDNQGLKVEDVSKIKILWHKKPIPPSKLTVADALEGDATATKDGKVEFGIMILGGVIQVEKPTADVASGGDAKGEAMEGVEETTPVAQGPSGKEVLETQEFWIDLKGFLVQRLRDEGEAERVVKLFKATMNQG